MPPAQRTVLTETVYDLIRRRLIEREIEPAGRLNIHALSLDLNVSPTPIREALARLEADGLVVRRSLAGYAAAPLLNDAQLDDLFEMRLLLEPAAAARAATRVTAADLTRLDALLAEMRRAAEAGDESGAAAASDKRTLNLFAHHDTLFHEQIAAAGANALMTDTLHRLHSHAHLYRLHFDGEMAAATCREHERIVEALRDAEPDSAAGAMRTHIRRARERLGGRPASTA